MSKHTLSIAPEVIIERVGDDVMVVVPKATEVVKLSGESAAAVLSVQAGDTSGLPPKVIAELVERGVLVSQAGLSRRDLVKAGAIGAGAGVTVLAMPAVAAASSPTEKPADPEKLFGDLFAGEWNDSVNAPAISAKVDAVDRVSWIAGVVVQQGAPYSINGLNSDDPVLDGGVAVEGTIVVGGLTRTAYLFVYSAGNIARAPFWFFKGTWTQGQPATAVPQAGADFELTFTFDGTPYVVTPAPAP